MFNVCIMGASLTTGNMGVSALAASVVKLIMTHRPDANITFFISGRTSGKQEVQLQDRKIAIQVANTRLSPRAAPGEHIFILLLLAFLYKIMPFHRLRNMIAQRNKRLKVIADADFIGDIRGGDSFSDTYGLKSFLMGSIPAVITLFMGKKLVLLPQTYGPYKSRISRAIAHYILNHARVILSRDKESMDLVRNVLGKNRKDEQIIFCPDVAFVLDAVAPHGGHVPPFKTTGKDCPIIGLNINGLLYNGGFTRDNMFNLRMDYKLFSHRLSESLLRDTRANLLLIPHTFAPPGHVESDPDACMNIFKMLEPEYAGRIQTVSGEIDQHTIKGIIGRCDFFIGSRMHACIAALSQSIPTVAVAYSKKFKGVFNSLAVGGYVIDARDIGEQEAVESVMTMFHGRTTIGSNLRPMIDDAKILQTDIFRRILQ